MYERKRKNQVQEDEYKNVQYNSDVLAFFYMKLWNNFSLLNLKNKYINKIKTT